MREPLAGARELAAEPCQSLCAWTPTDELRLVDGGPEPAAVFACRGCGSEWLRSELWTPIDADGRVPLAVSAEVARRRPSETGA
jgi:hypothetical protein